MSPVSHAVASSSKSRLRYALSGSQPAMLACNCAVQQTLVLGVSRTPLAAGAAATRTNKLLGRSATFSTSSSTSSSSSSDRRTSAKKHAQLTALTRVYHQADYYPNPNNKERLGVYIDQILTERPLASTGMPEGGNLGPVSSPGTTSFTARRRLIEDQQSPVGAGGGYAGASVQDEADGGLQSDALAVFKVGMESGLGAQQKGIGARRRAVVDALHGTVDTRYVGVDLAREIYDAHDLGDEQERA